MTHRLGDIQFLNSWPVTHALRAGWVRAPFQVVTGIPAVLNRKLLTGELDASAVSSVLYLRHQSELVPVPGFCIRSEGGVASVLVVSRSPLEQLRVKTIGVSNQGATTPALLKLLLKRHKLPMELEVTPLRYPEILTRYPAALLIGDEALKASCAEKSLFVWDLGEAWTDWTQAPSVYALWVIRRQTAERCPELLDQVQEALRRSYAWGQSHPDVLMAAMQETFPCEEQFLKRYLAGLSYALDDKAWEGLTRFAQEAETEGLIPQHCARTLPSRRDALVAVG